MTTTLTIYRLTSKHTYPRLKAMQSLLQATLKWLGETVSFGLWKPTPKPERLFAHLVRSDTLSLNGVAVLEADKVFLAAMLSNEDPARDREEIKRFALSGLRWPHKLRIEWDDTNEVWEI